MQDENLKVTLEETISLKVAATLLKVPETVVIKLCEARLLKTVGSDGIWRVFKKQELPCILQLKSWIPRNSDNFKILDNQYDLVDLEELAYWPFELINDENYVEFRNICIDRAVFKDPSNQLHTKYVLEIETFLNVAEWEMSLETILTTVDQTVDPTTTVFTGVFENVEDAYACAKELYNEIDLQKAITNQH
ncbi:hypothetical protein AB3U99_19030 [Niallia sp. JL1B1071]|uniref:hypothetical protein n=1 Tax=Niallia tiangongensis TaxID=3237105 RepID=UPI0037DC8C03